MLWCATNRDMLLLANLRYPKRSQVDQTFCRNIFFQIIHIACNQTLMALLQNTFDAFKFLHWMSVHENLRKPIFTYEIPLEYEKGLHTY